MGPKVPGQEPEPRLSSGSGGSRYDGTGIALPIQNDIVGQITEDGRLAVEKVKAQFMSASRSMGQAADKFRMAWTSFSGITSTPMSNPVTYSMSSTPTASGRAHP